MDCRNVTVPPPEVEDGKYLEKMFELQKDLMEGYIKIEGLPRYPISIHSKNSQVIFKDMAARSVEELAEGYESTQLACELMRKYGWNLDLLSEKEYQMLLNHLQNTNEEQADATAFLLELLIYTHVTEEDLRKFAQDVCGTELPFGAPLLDALTYTGIKLINEFNPLMMDIIRDTQTNLYHLVRRDMFNNEEDYQKALEYIPGWRNLSEIAHNNEMNILWQIEYHLGVGRNYLKNKPWKQTEELSDTALYYDSLYHSICKLFGYHAIMGLTPKGLYTIFWKKHCVNKFRQRSMY